MCCTHAMDLVALGCRDPFGLAHSSCQFKSPDSQTHITAFPPRPQLPVSHAIVSICCLTLLSGVAESIAVPCLGWLWCSREALPKTESWEALPKKGFLSFPAVRCSAGAVVPGAGAQAHLWCYSVASKEGRGGLISAAQVIGGFPGPREALMVAGAPSMLSP